LDHKLLIKNIILSSKYKSFLIAYSGGLDSTVLLHQLIELKTHVPEITIRAIHINHNLHHLSKMWSTYCQETCEKYQIPLVVKNININTKKNYSEKELRIQRYRLIYNCLLLEEILLTGHHMNDQCETFFLSLKRGSGPTGLSAMSFQTQLGDKKFFRPMLNQTKKTLEIWARNNKITWIEDFSNFDINYDRNYIRHKIIPILERKWPFFLKNCFRTTKICQEETALLNYFLMKKIKKFIRDDNSLNIKDFKNIKKEICTAFIRMWIALKKIQMPSYKNIQCIYNQIIFSKIDANPKFVLNKHEIRRYKNSLYLLKKKPSLNDTLLFWHDKNKTLILPNDLGYLTKNKKGINLPEPDENDLINIRFQYEGNVLILGKKHSKKIKKIWQEQNIPPWLRHQIPLLFYNDTLISALGVFVVKINNRNKRKWSISWSSNIILNHKNNFIFE
jgi:tRNA(Ile)-lysidine synthase